MPPHPIEGSNVFSGINGANGRGCSSTGDAKLRSLSSDAEELRDLLTRVTSKLVNYIEDCQREQAMAGPICDPQELVRRCDIAVPEGEGRGIEGVSHDLDTLLDNSIKTWNPGFMHKLYASTNPIGVISELVLGVMNNNAHVYTACPISSIIEDDLAKTLGRRIGWDSSICGGLTCPGGANSNILALVAARNFAFPSLREVGFAVAVARGELNGCIPAVFTSANAHYSIQKAAVTSGIGLANVIKVPCDSQGAMDPAALDRMLTLAAEHGYKPFFVNATAGTTVLGAFDPLEAIADICAKHNVWMHVDGSWGGPILLFPPERHNHKQQQQQEEVEVGAENSRRAAAPAVVRDLDSLMRGLRRADSVTLNPHKLMGVPLQCSYLLVRRGLGWLKRQVGMNASYLFHDDDVSATYDIGDASLGCGRRPDALKLWMAWRYYGASWFSERIAYTLHLSQELARQVAARSPRFRLLVAPPSTTVCFWYVPPALRPSVAAKISNDDLARLHFAELDGATKRIHAPLIKRGRVLIDYATASVWQDGSADTSTNVSGVPKFTTFDAYIGEHYAEQRLPAFFRIPLNSPRVPEAFLGQLLDEIELVSAELYPEGDN
ncbi:Glutamate decarboxylase 2 [Spiromyces aspiralis]|uniref:Glutamate decarboxylase 2 n=1 Tax=Spiromyces aspiralis TaxID=68401 RepID=A0ACC1HXB8_9FUNG|nr:Glutamate decarboxylase 2 [Spiromyces aspiralis]